MIHSLPEFCEMEQEDKDKDEDEDDKLISYIFDSLTKPQVERRGGVSLIKRIQTATIFVVDEDGCVSKDMIQSIGN